MRLAALLLFVALPAQAQMYKCVDQRGVTRYTDAAGPGCKPVDIRGSPPISGAIQPPAEDLARDEADFKRRQRERESNDLRERQALEQRCVPLRREQAVLSSGRRLQRINEKGEREYLEDAVREQRLAQLQRELAGCP
ncbi:MAG TPA: DUF4124 domain-containing protein [Burkholderiales bacterium]|nr:DUF4124 domain-containing protein [Burkholderiales bacterium]